MKTTWMYTLWALVLLVASERAHAFYNPNTGRWLNRDPIEERGGVNLYAVASNEPLSKIDTDGGEVGSICPKCGKYYVGICPNDGYDPLDHHVGQQMCGTVVTRAIGPNSGFFGQIGNACSRCISPHEFIIAGDGSDRRFDFKGTADKEGHWTATATPIWIPKGKSCKEFTDCLEREFKKILGDNSNPYNFTKNCQSAVRTGLKRCGGWSDLRPSLPPVGGFPK
jgi:hypothetical protein